MITLYDYLPSQNAYKVRLLLAQLERPYRTQIVSIFEGEGQRPEFLALNPMGTVPVLQLEDGRAIAESNAILCHLAEGTPYLPDDAYERAKVMQWLAFESGGILALSALRYWALTGKLEHMPGVVVFQALAARALRILEHELATRPFVAGERYTIADMSLFAYTHLAGDAGFPLAGYPAIQAWVARVKAQPRHLAEVFDYSIDLHAKGDLPSMLA